MGPYCNYCDMRCFVPRVLRTGESVILATCPAGMDNDLARTGQTHATAANPVLHQTEVFRIAVNPEPLTAASFCPFCGHHTAAHTHSAGADDVPCVGCRGGFCRQPPSDAAVREASVRSLAAGLDVPPELLRSRHGGHWSGWDVLPRLTVADEARRPDPEQRTCRKCSATIALIGGVWVAGDMGTTGDGLSYCPPDPDAARHGIHQPAAVR